MNDLSTLHIKLNDRILCADGDSIVSLNYLYDHLLNGGKASDVYLSKKDVKSEEVKKYNKRFLQDKVTYKKEINNISTDWLIPEKYKTLNIDDYLFEKLKAEINENEFTDEEIKQRFYRVQLELRIWKKRNLVDLLRSVIFIVNSFEEHKIIWGTGRGSSCASYVLYLIGLHQVDSVKYNLDISDFFR